MDAKELVALIVARTKLPHDEVSFILDTIRDITYEHVATLDSVILPGLLKIGVENTQSHYANRPWKLRLAPLRGLTEAVGRDVILG